jgi:hypothetical protein
MARPSKDELAELIDFLDHRYPAYALVCRWLMLGPELAPTLGEEVRAPATRELVELLRRLERRAPEHLPAARWLVGRSQHAERVRLEIALDRLLAAGDHWQHPAQVLPRCEAILDRLLEACTARRKRSRGERRRRLQRIEQKLRRASHLTHRAQDRRRDGPPEPCFSR